MSGFVDLTKSCLRIRRIPSVSCSTLRGVHTDFRDSVPLLPNLIPHLQTLLNFVTNTLPKPVLVALLYRLTVLQLASRILPGIGADSWDDEDGVDNGWEDRPVRKRSETICPCANSFF